MLTILAATMMLSHQSNLPVGVIEPYRWHSGTVPIHGEGVAGTEIIDRAVTDAMRQYGIVGCGICVCRGSEVLYCKGFGYSELPDKPFLPSTASRCGSLAKPITSLCALLLMGKGALNLDDKVLPILTSVDITPKPVDDRVKQMTVRELMDHTSGLPPSATYTSWRPERNLIDLLKLDRKPTSSDVAFDALASSHLDADPGSQYQYANANFVILARVIAARGRMTFDDYLSKVAMPKFGVPPDGVFVSKDQISPVDPSRAKSEAAYYQTTTERFGSFLPADASAGKVFGEAYRGYSSECADGAGGIAVSAEALAKILTNLRSNNCALSPRAIREILTPPTHYSYETGFDPARSTFYSKGLNVRFSGGVPWISHGGMTQHCGGTIGYNAGFQFAAVSNWNNSNSPYVDAILDHALGEAVAKLPAR